MPTSLVLQELVTNVLFTLRACENVTYTPHVAVPSPQQPFHSLEQTVMRLCTAGRQLMLLLVALAEKLHAGRQLPGLAAQIPNCTPAARICNGGSAKLIVAWTSVLGQ